MSIIFYIYNKQNNFKRNLFIRRLFKEVNQLCRGTFDPHL